ncbi:MAG: NADH-quinone oxidoreductase subunit A [bacterium]
MPTDPLVVVAVFAVLGLAFPAAPLIVSQIIAPRNPGKEKNRPYECGTVEAGDPWGQFKIQFYMYGLNFLVFDIEALFLFPWAVVFKLAGPLGLLEMLVFIGLLVLGWLYAWKQGALEWE